MKIENDQEYQYTRKCISEMVDSIKKLKNTLRKDGQFNDDQIKHLIAPQISFLLGFVDDAREYRRNKKKT